MIARKPSLGIRILSCYIAWSFFMAPLDALAEPVAALDDGVSGVEARDPLPPGSLTIGGLYTDDYWEGIGDVLVPLYFNGQGLFFINPRTSRTDNDASEFNLGLGYRQLIREREAIVGANLYYDYRDTTAGAQFHQVGVGLEYLSKHLDLRANIYAPTETREKVNEFSTTETSTSRSASREVRAVFDDPYATGHTVLQDYEQISLTRITTTTLTTTRFYEQYEIAFWGWDAEIGTEWSIPGLDDLVRIKPFAGVVNYYGRSGVSDIEAFRGRLEVHVGPSFFLDAVYLSDDSLNGGNFAVGAYLSLPFEIGNIAQGRNPFAGATEARYAGSGRDVSWRLGEMVKRDPQIRASVDAPEERKDKVTSTTETTGSTRTEDLGTGTAVILADVTFVNNENAASPDQDGTAENPYDSVQEGVDNANSPVWVFSGNAPYEESVVVPEGVQLYGQGTTIQALGGKTWGGGTHPVLIGQDAAPVVTILGNNTAVSGFDIRHSGAIPAVPVLDPVTSANITYAGIYGSQVSNVEIHDNIMTDGRLSYGIFVANNGTLPGGNINLVGSYLNNDIQNTTIHGLYLRGVGGSGTFAAEVSGNYSGNGSLGIYITADGYDYATADLHDITANANDGNGLSLWLSSDVGDTRATIRDFTANDNGADGINGLYVYANGPGANAIIDLQNLTLNGNGDTGLYSTKAHANDGGAYITLNTLNVHGNDCGISTIRATAHGANNDAVITLNNVSANDNVSYGIDELHSHAYGDGGDALLSLDNVQVNNNGRHGLYEIYSYAYGAGGNAQIDARNLVANNNARDGISEFYAYAGGVGGNASVVLNNVEVSNNQDDGIGEIAAYALHGDAHVELNSVTANENSGRGLNNIYATSRNGAAAVTLNAVEASGNSEYGIDYVVARAGDMCSGGGKGATIQLTDVVTDNNGYAGIFEITAESKGGDSSVLLDSVQANENARYGIEYVQARAYGDNGNADVIVRYTEASGNLDQDGIDRIFAEATGLDGDATTTVQDITANNNENSGIRSVESRSVDGAASVDLSTIDARFNGDYGVDRVDASAGGTGDDALITFVDSDLRDNTTDGYNVLTPTATGGGTADADVQNVQQ